MALCADPFGRKAELVAKSPGECFVGVVSGGEGYAEDIRSAIAQVLRRFCQAAAPHVSADRTTG